MDLTVQNVYGLLLRSQLLSLDESRAMFARWQEEAKDQAANLARFAAWMVSNRYLTEYQATLLARGHADGFFLGDYKILDRLGKGRMAGVYKAQHRLGQIVAIKVLPPSKARDANLLARFQREARLALRLRHPNIVRSYQVGKAGELHYLVMEYLEGETLEEVIARRKQLPPPEAVRLIFQALGGLQHIHEQGLVHRDLKPANLMLVPPPGADTLRSTVKILDIGLGRGVFEEGFDAQDPGLTGEGVLLGTPDYMAPEQARDPRGTDIRGDIYSLGCVLYHLLTGQTPFPDSNIISQMLKHATEAPRPLRDFNPSIPDGLQQILNWMMTKEASGRYPTPARAAQALEVFLAAGSAPATSPDLDPAMQPYLHWLETVDHPPNPPAPAATVAAPPVNLPPPTRPSSPAVPAARGSAPPVPGEKVRRKKKSSRPRERKKPPPPPVPSTGSDPARPRTPVVDVELVPLPEPAKGPGGLTRRDLLMFFAGVGSVIVAYVLGRLLAAVLGRPRSEEDKGTRGQGDKGTRGQGDTVTG